MCEWATRFENSVARLLSLGPRVREETLGVAGCVLRLIVLIYDMGPCGNFEIFCR